MPVLTSPANRRLAVAGALIALVVFGVFFAVGRGGREPAATTTAAGRPAPAAELGESAPQVGAVTGTSGSIPALKRRPEQRDTTGTTGTGTTDGTSATSTGTSTTSPPATTGTSTTTPPTTSGTTGSSTSGTTGSSTSGTTGPPPTTGTGTTTTTN